MAKLALAALMLLAQLQLPPAAQDTVTEIRGLVQAKLWAQVDARLDALAADDPAWARLSPVVYSAAVARQDLAAATPSSGSALTSIWDGSTRSRTRRG